MRLITFIIIPIASILLIGCVDQYNPEQAAQDYCDCMRRNGSPEQYEYAFKVCEGEMVKKYHYYRIFYVDMAHHELDKKVSDITRDSTKEFISRFMHYTNENLECCRETLTCPKDSLNVDTIKE